MEKLFITVGFAFLGYLFGSLPFSIWITQWVKGVDVRLAGSRHASTTNTIRQAGWGPGVVVLLLDISKGYIPTYLALHCISLGWVVPITIAMVVIGHCWPLFAQFRGGMGLACAGGGMLAASPLGFLIGLCLLITLVLLIHHAARASVITGILLSPVLLLFKQHGQIIWVALLIGIVISIRFLSDWKRKYRELWLDRGKTLDN
jgi:glycerol-3-phosphate acyltransferase PlsY